MDPTIVWKHVGIKLWSGTNEIPTSIFTDEDMAETISISCNLCSADIEWHLYTDGDLFVEHLGPCEGQTEGGGKEVIHSEKLP